MFRKKSLLLILLTLALTPVLAGQQAGTNKAGFRSMNDITKALNPLASLNSVDGIKRSIDLNIQFKINASQLLPAAQRQVAALGEAMNSSSLLKYGFLVIGHTDSTGGSVANQTLSKQRANTVRAALIKQYGIAKNRLISSGKGESQLIKGLAVNDARHRRVEIIAVLLNDMAGSGKGSKPPVKEHKKNGFRW